MTPSTLIKLLAVTALATVLHHSHGQLCHTNYEATFNWGSNSITGDTINLFASGKQIGNTAVYPQTNIDFSVYQIPNQSTLYLQAQRGSTVLISQDTILFDTNNYPLVWGVPTFNGIKGK